MTRTRMAVFGALALAGSAMAQDSEQAGFDDRWYVGVMGGVARPGEDRLTDSTVGYFGAYIGRFFSPHLSLDLQIDAYPAEFEAVEFANETQVFPADDDFDIYGYGATGRWHFGDPGNRHRPYGLVGLGIAEHDSAFDDGRDIYVSWGVGLQSKFGRNLRLRTQLEGRYDNDRETFARDNGFIDMIASVGLSWSFGGAPNAAPAPAATQAPPPEQVAEPPRPMPPQRPAPEPEVAFEFDATVLFAFDSAALRDDARAELDEAAGVLAPRDGIVLIEVAGHTDSIGTDEYNQRLSERRAQAVADHLAARGVDRDRMRVVGFGESQPKVPNTTPANRQQNRRVVISTIDRR